MNAPVNPHLSRINGKQNPAYRKWRYDHKETDDRMFKRGSDEARTYYSAVLRRERAKPENEQKRIDAIRKSKKMKEILRRVQVPGLGIKMNPKIFSLAAGENHVAARVWSVRSPAGVHYRFKNLNAFIRGNTELFEADDVIWRVGHYKLDCKARNGISGLRPSEKRKKISGSWKGWVWVTLNERALGNADNARITLTGTKKPC
jgi:hypothetical protein